MTLLRNLLSGGTSWLHRDSSAKASERLARARSDSLLRKAEEHDSDQSTRAKSLPILLSPSMKSATLTSTSTTFSLPSSCHPTILQDPSVPRRANKNSNSRRECRPSRRPQSLSSAKSLLMAKSHLESEDELEGSVQSSTSNSLGLRGVVLSRHSSTMPRTTLELLSTNMDPSQNQAIGESKSIHEKAMSDGPSPAPTNGTCVAARNQMPQAWLKDVAEEHANHTHQFEAQIAHFRGVLLQKQHHPDNVDASASATHTLLKQLCELQDTVHKAHKVLESSSRKHMMLLSQSSQESPNCGLKQDDDCISPAPCTPSSLQARKARSQAYPNRDSSWRAVAARPMCENHAKKHHHYRTHDDTSSTQSVCTLPPYLTSPSGTDHGGTKVASSISVSSTHHSRLDHRRVSLRHQYPRHRRCRRTPQAATKSSITRYERVPLLIFPPIQEFTLCHPDEDNADFDEQSGITWSTRLDLKESDPAFQRLELWQRTRITI